MRRLTVAVGIAVMALWQPSASAQEARAPAEKQEGETHEILVQLVDKKEGPYKICVATHPMPGEPDYRVHVKPGDSVQWVFANNCTAKEAIEVGIAHFQPPPRFASDERDCPDRRPLIEGCTLRVRVEKGTKKQLEPCPVKKHFWTSKSGITWKYDVVRYVGEYEYVLLDPELEIPRAN